MTERSRRPDSEPSADAVGHNPLTGSGPGPQGARTVPTPAIKGMRALVIDDHAASAAAIARMLERSGYEAVVCTESTLSVALAVEEQPDLIGLDILMPELGGFEVLSLIRSHEHSRRRPSVPVIAISGLGSDADKARAISEGFLSHLAKPVVFSDLWIALQCAVTLRQALRRTRFSNDRDALLAWVERSLGGAGGERIPMISGLAMVLERESRDRIRQCLIEAYNDRPQHAARAALELARLATTIGARELRDLAAALEDAVRRERAAFETAAALARAEVDRLVFTLRDCVDA